MEGCKISLICLTIIVLLVYGRGQSAGRNACGSNQRIPCDNGECIKRDEWCDDEIDCEDGSDENYCRTAKRWWSIPPDNHCTGKHFVCKSGRCVPVSVKCDEFDDCGDYSDEENCEQTTTEDASTSGFDEENERAGQSSEMRENETVTDTFSHYNGDAYGEPPRRSTTSTTPRIHTITTAADYYLRRMNTNDQTRQTSHYPNQNRGYYPGRTQNDHYNYSERYPGVQPPNRGSDTSPSRNFPPNQYLSTTPSTTTNTYDPSPAYRAEQDPPRISRNSYAERRRHMIIPPRSVLYPPAPRPSYSNRYKSHKPALPLFYFSRNYTAEFAYNYETNIEDAKKWLLQQRDDSYSWGRDTPRGLIALSLITNSFTSDITDNELMKKSLQTHLGIKLLRNNTGVEKLSTTRLAMYINALLATCQDPRDFLGLDLAEILHSRKNTLESFQTFVNPLVYLSLCLTNKTDMWQDTQALERLLVSTFPDEVSKDIHILATTAMSCLLQQDVYNQRLISKLSEAFQNLLRQENSNDGSFGSIYTTALAAQALMSTNLPISWSPRLTLSYLSRHQMEDGSFGDIQATYYILLALSGRNLLHLRNTHCDPTDLSSSPSDTEDTPGPKKSIFYSLRVGYPETFSTSIQLTLPVNSNFFNAMRVAAYSDPRFKFSYKITNDQLGVHTIANVPNDAERGLLWNLYVLGVSNSSVDLSQRYTGDIRTLIPSDGDELLYWYLPMR